MVRVRASKKLRMSILCGTVAGVVLLSSVKNSLESGPDIISSRRSLEVDFIPTSNCTLDYPEYCADGGCDLLDDFLYVCCRKEGAECITYHQDECTSRDICAAELIPGGNGAGECLGAWEPGFGGGLFYVLVLIYLFLGLAIVCDDYFVTSLEKISNGLGLSNDVAGATFMAAGSSAPELFVSLADNVIANPPKSLGIGTIIGSAIFNILVIIGLSALLAGQKLKLDWRPLARDVTFYCISILALTLVVNDEEVQVFEALILLLLYVGYIVFMSYNERFFQWLDTKLGTEKVGKTNPETLSVENDTEEASSDNEQAVVEEVELQPISPIQNAVDTSEGKETSLPQALAAAAAEASQASADGAVERRNSVDANNKRKSLNPIHQPGNRVSWRGLRAGTVRGRENSVEIAGVFHDSSDDEDDKEKRTSSKRTSLQAGESSNVDQEAQTISVKNEQEDEGQVIEGGYWESLFWPTDNDDLRCGSWNDLWKARLWHVVSFPYALLFRLTIPDCSRDVFREDKQDKPENRKRAYWLCFFMCVVWIAFLSHLLVYAATKFGCVAGISPTVMGLTIVAAGTSVPDAISSIIVARQGQGDMAVANSIGSNVFDILLGLGLPWLLATAFVYKVPTQVQKGDLIVSLFFLFGVVFALVGILVKSKWEMSSNIGKGLLAMYAGYVLFELVIHPLI